MSLQASELEILSNLKRDQKTVMVSGDGLDIVFQSKIFSLDPHKVALQNTIRPFYIRDFMKSKNFIFHAGMMRFHSSLVHTDGVHILFPLKDLRVISETRRSERVPFESHEQVCCELLNPFDGETILQKTVIDMSATGLSIRSPVYSDLFANQTRFDQLRILIDGEPYTRAAATVVYRRRLVELGGRLTMQIGLRLDSAKEG